jgi:hypothetical protein
VVDGYFSVSIDFGPGKFTGDARWLYITVRGPGEIFFTGLLPRQPINAAPYALHALNATGGGDSQWSSSGGNLTYSGGNVGIGTTTPTSKLEIAAQNGLKISGFQPFMTLKDTNTNLSSLFAGGNGDFGWYPNSHIGGNPAMILRNGTGRLGVGTTSPTGKIHAESSSGSEAAILGKNTGDWVGVYGESANFRGVYGKSTNGTGIQGESGAAFNSGVNGYSTNAQGWGGYFSNSAGGTALYANGLTKVKTLEIMGGADIVEGFETGGEALEPGTVVVIDESHPGELRASKHAYDHRVAGIVSGAGGIAPGIRLGQEAVMDGETPVAMSGRVYVRCSVQNGKIRPGDLLTTSDHPGLAMRAGADQRAHGAIVGKAMTALDAGTGLVLVLVNLH